MADNYQYAEAIKNDISTILNEGTKGSFLTSILDETDVESAYKTMRGEEKELLKQYKQAQDKGEASAAMSANASFASSLTKALSSRYASRINLFKVGYDDRLANAASLAHATNKATDMDKLFKED